ncbi:hypothetical protein D0T12_05140 [Actinomadura spongiicola]|uniref:Uncharacterized protein n=1 Tax=Actinomadura spongiicola TaxID=2303421 RepID=A0A372GLP4_9ACTN|nr:hypothetical protein [Actinomadura spongiicola]RFS86019.1 hypothetical protein D0T12_05140 [Actinomadura spongiicola]
MRADWAVAELERRFPGVSAWWGEFTGRWWAVTRDWTGRYRLVEASTPGELAVLIAELRRPIPHHVPRYSRDQLRAAPPPRPTRRRRAVRQGWLCSVLGGLITT